MLKTLKKDTLAYQLKMRPWTRLNGAMFADLPDVVTAMQKFMSAANLGHYSGSQYPESHMGHPEQDALVFYTLNHAVSIIRSRVHELEPLGAYYGIVDEYNTQLSMRSIRMFYYLLVICTRESRHERTSTVSWLWDQFKKDYGELTTKFCINLRGKGSSGAVSSLLTDPPKTTLGNYTQFLVDVFAKGDYPGGYGGKAWAEVARVLNDYVQGVISAEIMLDTAFTLCHNNGPIFNKGVFFEGYSAFIYKILDVQRSGQIPQLFNSNEKTILQHSIAVSIFGKCRDVLGGEFHDTVDWYKVEALGSMKKYPNEKAAQKKVPEPVYAEKGGPKSVKAKHESAPTEPAPEAVLKVMPGVTVSISKRKPK